MFAKAKAFLLHIPRGCQLMSHLAKAVLLISVAFACALPTCLAQRQAAPPSELLKNPNFDSGAKGWFLRSADVVSDKQISGQIVVLKGVGDPEAWSHVGINIDPTPTDQELKFSCMLRGDVPKTNLMINAFAYNNKDDCIAKWHSDFSVDKAKWTKASTVYNAPKNSKYLAIWIVNPNKTAAYACMAGLKAGPKKKSGQSIAEHAAPAEQDNTLVQATFLVRVKGIANGKFGVVSLPIPGLYREQFPLTFKLAVQPAGALLDYHFTKRADGRNWLCKVNVKPPNNGEAIITWKSLLLISGRKKKDLPKVQLSELAAQLPAEAKPWLRSTACVQSADAGIKSKAEELGKNITDLESYAKSVIKFTSENTGKPGVEFNSLDAKKALACGGSCTSKANLAAALFRAHGIPARTVSHLPTWFDGPMFEHWLTEYWHPGAGWVWVEPTLERFQPAPNELPILAVSSPEDEDKAFDPIQVRYIMPGAAYLSGCLLSPDLYAGGKTSDDCSQNRAKQVGTISGTEREMNKLFETAQRNFYKLMRTTQESTQTSSRIKEIEIASRSGKASELETVLK